MITATDIERAKLETKHCERCGTAIVWSPGQNVDRFESRRYCSMACANAAKRKYQPKNCIHCQAEFSPNKATSKFCSHECYTEAARRAALHCVRQPRERKDLQSLNCHFPADEDSKLNAYCLKHDVTRTTAARKAIALLCKVDELLSEGHRLLVVDEENKIKYELLLL